MNKENSVLLTLISTASHSNLLISLVWQKWTKTAGFGTICVFAWSVSLLRTVLYLLQLEIRGLDLVWFWLIFFFFFVNRGLLQQPADWDKGRALHSLGWWRKGEFGPLWSTALLSFNQKLGICTLLFSINKLLQMFYFLNEQISFPTKWDVKKAELTSGREHYTNDTLSRSFHKPREQSDPPHAGSRNLLVVSV